MASGSKIRRYIWLALPLAGLCVAGGLLSLPGSFSGSAAFSAWFVTGRATGPFSSTAAVASGIAIFAFIANRRTVALLAGAIVCVIGTAALLEGIARILGAGVTSPPFIAPLAHVSWMLLGTAIVLLARSSATPQHGRRISAPNVAVILTAASFGIAALTPNGTGGSEVLSVVQLTSITLQTSIFLISAATALTIVNVESEPMRLINEDGPAGTMVRRALPLVLIAAFAFGLIHIIVDGTTDLGGFLRMLFRGIFELGLLTALVLWLARTVEAATEETRSDRDTLRKIADSMPQVVWIAGSDGKLEYTNERAQNFFLPTTNGNGKALPVQHAEDEAAAEAAWHSSRESRETYVHEHRLLMPDGTYRWHLTRAVPVSDGATGDLKWYGTATDIEVLKSAAETNRLNEERFVRFMENLPGLAWIKDAQGRYVFANNAAAEAFGRAKDELYGKTDSEIFPAETAETFAENDRLALAESSGLLTVEVLTDAHGTTRHSLVSKFPIELPGGAKMVGGIAIDVTDRKRTADDQAFLFGISETLRLSASEVELLDAIASELGGYLGASRCLFVEVDTESDRAVVTGEYSSTGERVQREYAVSRYSKANRALLESGKTVSVSDTRSDPTTRDYFESTYGPNGELSYIAVPHLRDGKWVGTLWCSLATEHDWSKADVALLENVSQRSWAAIERLRFHEQIVNNRQALFELIELAPFGLYIIDANFRVAMLNSGSRTGPFANVPDVVGHDFEEALRIIWPEPAATEIVGIFRRTLETGEPYRSWDFVEQRNDIDLVESYEWEVHRIRMPDGGFGAVCYYFDTTKLRDTQAALIEREAQLQAIYGGSFGYLGLLSATGTVLDVNQSALRFGPISRGDVVGKPFWQTVWFAKTPGAPEKIRIGLKQAAGGEFVRYELALVKPDGETAYFDFSLRPIRDKSGEVNYIVPEWRDITALKRIEDEIRQISTMPEQNPNPVLRVSGDGALLYANPASESARKFWQKAHGKEVDPEILELVMRSLESGQRQTIEVTLLHDTYEFVIAPVPEGNYANVYASDITARKVSELALKESEQRFRHASDSAPVLIWMSDRTKNAIWFNKPWLSYTGRKMAEEVEEGWLDGIHPNDRDRVLRRYTAAFEKRESFAIEYRLRRYDGEYRWMLNNGAARFAGDEEFLGYIGSCVDISERLSTERALRRSEARLQLAARVGSFGTWDINYQKDEVIWSDRLLEILGVNDSTANVMSIEESTKLAESLGVGWLLVSPKDHDRVQRTRDWKFRRPDTGEVRWLTAISQHFYGDGAAFPHRCVGVVQDITERRSSEELVRQSEERLRLAQQAGNVGIWDWDAASNSTYWSEQMWTIYGMEPGTPEPVQEVWSELIHPDDRGRVVQKLNDAREGGSGDYHDEFRVQLKDGTVRWVETHATVERDESGKAVRIYGMNRDTTEKRAVEELIRASESQLRLVTDSIPALVSYIDRERRYIFVNRQYREWFGRDPEELRGKSMVEVLGPAAVEKLGPRIEAVLTGEQQNFESWVNYNGVNRFVNISYVPQRNESGWIEGFYALVTDLTAQKRSQDLLRSSEEKMRIVTESFQDYAIIATDTRGIVENWNLGAVNIFGWSEVDILGKSADIVFTPEDRALGIPEQERQSARASGRASDERWHIRKNGTRFFASGVMVPLYVGEEHTGYAKIATDLTERKRNAEALQRAYDEMEMHVLERTRELSETNAALFKEIGNRKTAELQRIGLLQRLVTGQEQERKRIARDIHDQLGQRLTALRLKLQSLLEGIRGGTENQELLERATRLQQIAEILDSDVSFLAWELRPTILDELGLTDAIETFVKEWARHYEKQADYVVTGFADLRLHHETETHLYRITQEALNNVLKHADADNVSVLLERSGDNVVLIIEDNGRGFDPDEHLSRDAGQGGLGLSGMRERAELVGGTLEVESTPGVGTTIYIKFKLSEEKNEVRGY